MHAHPDRYRRLRVLTPLLVTALAASTLAGQRLSADESTPVGVSADNLRAHVDYLSRDELTGRDSGEAGLEVAAEYLANHFRRYGLEPAGDGGSYFQHFTVPAGAAFARQSGARVTLQGGAEIDWNPGSDIDAFGFADPAVVDAPLVFAGYGITTSAGERERGDDYDDYDGVDVEGKVVILLRFTPEGKEGRAAFGGRRSRHAPFVAKLENARKHGAVGAVIVTPTGHDDEDPYGLAHRAAPRQPTLPALVARRAAVDLVLRASGTSIARLVASIGENLTPRSFELTSTKIRFSTTRRHLRLRNVAARLRGSDPAVAGESLVIGGHYDHIGRFGNQVKPGNLGLIHNGADDNASGTAGIIELARLLSQGERPRRSIDFVCFSGEEIGLFGSRYWVNDAPRRFLLRDLTRALEKAPDPHGDSTAAGLVWEQGTLVRATGQFRGDLVRVETLAGTTGWVEKGHLEQIAGPTPIHDVVAMINLDMIGRGRDDRPVQVLGAATSVVFEELLERLSKASNQPLKLGQRMGGGGSDHFHFQRKKIPYLFFFTGMHAQYNTPDDDLETVNIAVQSRIVDVAWKSALHLSNAPQRPPFAAAEAGGSTSPHGDEPDRPRLGILSDGSYSGKGVKVTETVDGSPAGNSDLQAGDLIVRFADSPVDSIADLREALATNPQGDVEVVVLRDDEQRKILVSFPRRGGFRVSFGSVPDYAFAEKGVRFEDIRENTPAAKAGVKAGDVLVSWNGEAVSDVEHWTRLLGGHKPGDKVKIEVRRSDELVSLTVTLEGR